MTNPADLTERLGRILRRERIAAGLTIEAFCEQYHTTPDALESLEGGRYRSGAICRQPLRIGDLLIKLEAPISVLGEADRICQTIHRSRL